MDDGRLHSVIVVDSSVWIDHFANRMTDAVKRLRSIETASDILVGDIVLLEVLRGARSDAHAHEIEKRLRQFETTRMLDVELALRAAANYRRLRGLGVTMSKMADLIIGTYCIDRGHTLLHQDRDFGAMVKHLDLRLA